MRGGASLGCSQPQGRKRVSSGASQPTKIKEAQGGLVGPPKTKVDKSLQISLCTQATPGLPGWDASMAPGNSWVCFCSLACFSFIIGICQHLWNSWKGSHACFWSLGVSGKKLETQTSFSEASRGEDLESRHFSYLGFMFLLWEWWRNLTGGYTQVCSEQKGREFCEQLNWGERWSME